MANNTKDNLCAPLWEGMLRHRLEQNISFHTPGHKGRVLIEDSFSEYLGQAMSCDFTELPGLDNLAHPTEIIQVAQGLAAEAFGAADSFFLVNGSTVGIQAMIMSACPPGSKILVPRNVHRSVISGMILADVIPVYFDSGIDQQYGIAYPFNLAGVKYQLDTHRDIKAVLVINPTYHGLCGPLRDLVSLVHEYELPILVDEAHGTHFSFHAQLPVSAMQAGADLCVQSWHKTGLALTQSSILHWRSSLVEKDQLVANLQLLQSSSPSYLLMASLDWARAQMVHMGHARLDTLLDDLVWLEQGLSDLNGIESLHNYWRSLPQVHAVDPCKIAISALKSGIDGAQLVQWCNAEGIQVELNELGFVLGIATMHTMRQDLQRLLEVLSKLSINRNGSSKSVNSVGVLLEAIDFEPNMYIPKQVMTPRQAWFAAKKRVPLEGARNRVMAELLAPCPPGISLACPGELIDDQVLADCKRWGVDSLLVVSSE